MCTACLSWRLRPASSIKISASRLAPSFVRLSTVSFDLAAIQPSSLTSLSLPCLRHSQYAFAARRFSTDEEKRRGCAPETGSRFESDHRWQHFSSTSTIADMHAGGAHIVKAEVADDRLCEPAPTGDGRSDPIASVRCQSRRATTGSSRGFPDGASSASAMTLASSAAEMPFAARDPPVPSDRIGRRRHPPDALRVRYRGARRGANAHFARSAKGPGRYVVLHDNMIRCGDGRGGPFHERKPQQQAHRAPRRQHPAP